VGFELNPAGLPAISSNRQFHFFPSPEVW